MSARRRSRKRLTIRRSGAIAIVAFALAATGLAGYCAGRRTGTPPGARPYREIIARWCAAYNVNADMVAAVVEAESSGRPEAVSSSGALGLMQLMPTTAAAMARELSLDPPSRRDLFDPECNIRLGVYYLSKLRARFGDERELVIAAYHAGPTRVDAWRRSRADLSAAELIEELAFPETRRYLGRVMSIWKRIAAERDKH